MSLDGYITGPNDGPGRGLGEGGERLHYWVFGDPWTYATEKLGEATGKDKEHLDRMISSRSTQRSRGTPRTSGTACVRDGRFAGSANINARDGSGNAERWGTPPKNTIASFAKAIEVGSDEVEADAWLVDGDQLVISHDRPGYGIGLALDEVLDFCRGRMGVNVELKCEASETLARETGRRSRTF